MSVATDVIVLIIVHRYNIFVVESYLMVGIHYS